MWNYLNNRNFSRLSQGVFLLIISFGLLNSIIIPWTIIVYKNMNIAWHDKKNSKGHLVNLSSLMLPSIMIHSIVFPTRFLHIIVMTLILYSFQYICFLQLQNYTKSQLASTQYKVQLCLEVILATLTASTSFKIISWINPTGNSRCVEISSALSIFQVN